MASKKIPSEDITTLDRLLYIGNRSMGALEYMPAEEFNEDESCTKLDLDKLCELNEELLLSKDSFRKKLSSTSKSQALRLIRVGSSAGGARSKALVAINKDKELFDGTLEHDSSFSYWLLKFDTASNSDREGKDPVGMTKVEYIYSLIAKECEIDIPRTDYIEHKKDFHFLIERFDRVQLKGKLQKLHYVSWAGLEHADRDSTGVYSYEQLVLLVRKLKLGQGAVSEVFKRAVFNIVGRNQDDHTKNFGFLMNKKGEWCLSPAFDLTYSFDYTGKWTKVHQISLNGRRDGFSREDLLSFGDYCNLSNAKATAIIERVLDAFSTFKNHAELYDVDDNLRDTILQSIRTTV